MDADGNISECTTSAREGRGNNADTAFSALVKGEHLSSNETYHCVAFNPAGLSAFTLFPKLPWELRDFVWSFSNQTPRTIEVKLIGGRHHGTINYWAEQRTPPLFHVNRESKSHAEKHYELISTTSDRLTSSPPIYINFSLDTLCLKRSPILFCTRKLFGSNALLKKVQNLALQGAAGHFGHLGDKIAESFPNVRQVVVYSYDPITVEAVGEVPYYVTQNLRKFRSRWAQRMERMRDSAGNCPPDIIYGNPDDVNFPTASSIIFRGKDSVNWSE
jgi:hypothetical protein